MSIIGDMLTGKTSSKGSTSSSGTSKATFAKGTLRGGSGGRLTFGSGGGSATLPASIAERRNLLRQDVSSLLGDVRGDTQSLRSNQNPFIQARVRPSEDRFSNLLADTRMGLERRGVEGTLANNEIARLTTGANREIADQQALATQESLGAVLQNESFARSLMSDLQGLNQEDLQQVLAELGLSAEVLNVVLGRPTGGKQTGSGFESGTNRDAGKGIGAGAGLLSSAFGFFA